MEPAEVQHEARIQNFENEIRLLYFHWESLAFRANLVKGGDNVKAAVDIVSVKSMPEAMAFINEEREKDFLSIFEKEPSKQNIQQREEYFHIWDEIAMIVLRINTMQSKLLTFKEHSARIKNQEAMLLADQEIVKLVNKAKRLIPQLEGVTKAQMEELVDRWGKGLTTLQSKISFIQALKFVLMKAGQEV